MTPGEVIAVALVLVGLVGFGLVLAAFTIVIAAVNRMISGRRQ